VIYMCAKFEVSSFNRSQDMVVVTKFKKKIGHVTPSRPLWTDTAFFVIASRGLYAYQIWSF